MPEDPEDFRIDTFERLWFSAIFVTAFAGFWLLFGTIAWALSNDVELFVVGERAFAAIAGAALVIGWSSCGTPSSYNAGTRTEGTVLEIRKTQHTEDEYVTRPDGSENPAHRRAQLLCAGHPLRHQRWPRDRVPWPRRQRHRLRRG